MLWVRVIHIARLLILNQRNYGCQLEIISRLCWWITVVNTETLVRFYLHQTMLISGNVKILPSCFNCALQPLKLTAASRERVRSYVAAINTVLIRYVTILTCKMCTHLKVSRNVNPNWLSYFE